MKKFVGIVGIVVVSLGLTRSAACYTPGPFIAAGGSFAAIMWVRDSLVGGSEPSCLVIKSSLCELRWRAVYMCDTAARKCWDVISDPLVQAVALGGAAHVGYIAPMATLAVVLPSFVGAIIGEQVYIRKNTTYAVKAAHGAKTNLRVRLRKICDIHNALGAISTVALIGLRVWQRHSS